MLKLDLLSTAEGEGRRGPACVLDLAPIDVALRELLHEVVAQAPVAVGHAGLAEECAPDLDFGGDGELAEVQGDVDARQEGLVEGGDAVRGEEEDAAVVLDVAQAGRTQQE